MGALFAKGGCGPCFDRKSRRISPEPVDEMSIQERRRSEEIIEELKSCGIVATETAKGGMSFDIMPSENMMQRKPSRLPPLLRNNAVEPEATEGKSKEKLKNAAIRRQDALDKKAKVGKMYDAKRMAVLERREQKMKAKIRKTEEKLKRGNHRESTK